MEWRDHGVLLTTRRHAESAAIVDVFTAAHGRHAGVVHGGGSRRMAPVLQPGTEVAVEWRARLEDHLGTFRVEPLAPRAPLLMQDRAALAALNAICALLHFTLGERDPHPRLFARTQALLGMLGTDAGWPGAYLDWEIGLLGVTGFGLDLERCAVTGETTDLAHVSPRTGRAVSRAGAGEWADRLLPYPDSRTPEGILAGLRTTGHFLEHRVARSLGDRPLPGARARLVERLERKLRKT